MAFDSAKLTQITNFVIQLRDAVAPVQLTVNQANGLGTLILQALKALTDTEDSATVLQNRIDAFTTRVSNDDLELLLKGYRQSTASDPLRVVYEDHIRLRLGKARELIKAYIKAKELFEAGKQKADGWQQRQTDLKQAEQALAESMNKAW